MNLDIPANQSVPKYLEKFIVLFSSIRLSLRSKIIISFFTVIILLSATNTILTLEVMRFNNKYDAIMTNITSANSINGYIKPAIDTEMWNIVAGKKEFKDGSQYQIIDSVNHQLESMITNASSDKSRIKLEVIRRTMNTLTRYVDKMGQQIQQGSRVADNEKVLTDIRGVSDVVEATTQEYMLFEVNQAEQEYLDNKNRFTQLVIIYLIWCPAWWHFLLRQPGSYLPASISPSRSCMTSRPPSPTTISRRW
jgi:two-component system sensor histidine kinase YesM